MPTVLKSRRMQFLNSRVRNQRLISVESPLRRFGREKECRMRRMKSSGMIRPACLRRDGSTYENRRGCSAYSRQKCAPSAGFRLARRRFRMAAKGRAHRPARTARIRSTTCGPIDATIKATPSEFGWIPSSCMYLRLTSFLSPSASSAAKNLG